MKLLGTKTSPYTRKIRILLNAVGEDYLFVSTRAGSGAELLAQVAPLAKVPVLVNDEQGLVLPDSGLILDWLCAHRGSALRAAGFELERAAWQDRAFAVVAEGALDAAINRRYIALDGVDVETGYLKKQQERVVRSLTHLDDGARFTRPVGLGALTLGCALDWMAFRSAVDLSRFPGLSRFRDDWTASGVGAGTEPDESPL